MKDFPGFYWKWALSTLLHIKLKRVDFKTQCKHIKKNTHYISSLKHEASEGFNQMLPKEDKAPKSLLKIKNKKSFLFLTTLPLNYTAKPFWKVVLGKQKKWWENLDKTCHKADDYQELQWIWVLGYRQNYKRIPCPQCVFLFWHKAPKSTVYFSCCFNSVEAQPFT